MTSEFGNAKRLPFAPADRSTAPIEAAIPTQIVDTSDFTKFIVSTIASPAVTDPPGEFMYSWMSFFESV